MYTTKTENEDIVASHFPSISNLELGEIEIDLHWYVNWTEKKWGLSGVLVLNSMDIRAMLTDNESVEAPKSLSIDLSEYEQTLNMEMKDLFQICPVTLDIDFLLKTISVGFYRSPDSL